MKRLLAGSPRGEISSVGKTKGRVGRAVVRSLAALYVGLALVAVSCAGPEAEVGVMTEELVIATPTLPAAVGRTAVDVQISDSGTMNATTSIAVPPGRLGAQPSIGVAYSSGSSDGAMGVGWSLSGLSRISLCPQNMALDGKTDTLQFNGDDPLCLDGRRMFLTSGTHAAVGANYRVEEGQERVVLRSGSISDATMLFEVRHPDGTRVYYGGGSTWALSARRYHQPSPGGAPTLTTAESTLAWLGRRMRDPAGNTVDYTYERTVPVASGSPAAEVVLTRIDYPGFQPSPDDLTSGVEIGTRRVDLQYFATRTNPTVAYVAGFPILQQRLLRYVDTSGPLNAGRWTLRHYDFEYSTGAVSGRARLSSIRECDGHFSYSAPTTPPPAGCLTPTTFVYTDDTVQFVDDPKIRLDPLPNGWANWDMNAWSYAPSYVVPYDPGDGRDGLLAWQADASGNREWVFHRSTGTNLLSPVSTGLPVLANTYGLASLVQPLAADVDGNGTQEIVAREPDPAAPNNRLQTTVWTPGASSFPLARAYVNVGSCTNAWQQTEGLMPGYLLDADGNGRTDIIAPCSGGTTPRTYTWPHLAISNAGVWAPDASFGMLGTVLLEARLRQTYTVDLEGDGRHEVLIPAHNGTTSVDWYIGRQAGQGSTVAAIDLSTNNEYIFLDVNGDGLRDAIEVQRVSSDPPSGAPPGCGNTLCESTETVQTCPFDCRMAPQLHVNTGRGFLPPSPAFAAASSPGEFMNSQAADYRVTDINQDGRDDVVLLVSGPVGGGVGWTRIMLSVGSGFRESTFGLEGGFGTTSSVNPYYSGPGWQQVGIAAQHNWPVQQFFDYDGDGRRDWMYILLGTGGVRTQHNLTNRSDLLIRVQDQTEGTEVDYTTLGDRNVHFISKECPADLQCPRRGGLVVARVRRGNGIGTLNETQYQYTDARVDPRGRGFLGFQEVRVTEPRGTAHYRRYDLATSETINGVLRFPGSRMPYEEQTAGFLTTSGRTFAEFVTRKVLSVTSGTTDPLPLTRATTETTSRYEGGALIQNVTNDVEYDGDALPSVVDRTVSGGSRTVTGTFRSTSTVGSNYHVGRVETVSVTSYPLATAARSMTRVTATTYDANNLLDTQVVYGTSGSRDVTTHYVRAPGSRGQVTRVEMTGFEPSGFTGTTWTTLTRTADIGYDAEFIFPTTATNSLGQTDTTYTHPIFGLPVQHTNVSGDTDLTYYDGFGRIVREQTATGAGADITYSAPPVSVANGLVNIRVDGFDGSQTITTLDKLGRAISTQQEIRTASGLQMATTSQMYDMFGRVRNVMNPVFGSTFPSFTQFTYDELDRPTRETRQDGAARRWSYVGRTTTATDFGASGPGPNTQTTTLDADMRFLERDEGPGGRVTRYEYGFFDQVERVRVMPRPGDSGATATYEYIANGSSIGLPDYTKDPDAGQRDYLFNTFGELRAARDAIGNVNLWTRDVLGRTTRLDTAEEGATTWGWDGTAGVGRLRTTCAQVGAVGTNCVDYTYASGGLVAQENRTSGALLQTNYVYTSIGQLSTITYPSRSGARPAVRYQYDAAGMLSVVDNPATGSPYFSVQDRDVWGNAVRERSGIVTASAGVETTRNYDQVGRLATTASRTGTAGAYVQNLTYTFDNNSNVRTRVDSAAGGSELMEYDSLNRIIHWARTGTSPANEFYGYDTWGNPTSMRTAAPTSAANQTFGTASVSMRPHALARGILQTVDNVYDPNGRVTTSMTGGVAQTHTWTSFGVPRTVTRSGTNTRFDYGPNHERVRRYVSATEDILYAGDLYESRIIAQNATQVFHIFAEGREVAQMERTSAGVETVLYPLSDALGTSSTIATATGALFERHQFNPWGRRIGVASTSAIRHRFTGHEAEDGLGSLINMRGRVFDPNVGRFLTADPVTQAPTRAQGLNRYSYVFNNPATNTDPTGMECDGRGCYGVSLSGGYDPGYQQAFESTLHNSTLVVAGISTSDVYGSTSQIGQVLGAIGFGLAVGFGTGVGVAYILGFVAGLLGAPFAVAIGVGLLAYGVYNLYDAAVTGRIGAAWDRWATGRETVDDYYAVSLIAGGLLSGSVGPRAFTSARGLGDAISTTLRLPLRPVNGIINIGGTGENPGVTNANPFVANTGGSTEGIENLVVVAFEDIDEMFAPGSAAQIIANRLPFHTVRWTQAAQAAARVLRPGGTMSLSIRGTVTDVENRAIIGAFLDAGFESASFQGDHYGTLILGTRK